jgi:hypothetical protein
LSWAMIDSLFEAAQHPAVSRRLLSTLPALLEHVPVIDNAANFLRFGTFDPFDLLAIGLGACAAWATCRTFRGAESK